MAQVSPIGKLRFGQLITAEESAYGDAPFWSCAITMSELDSQPLLQLLEDVAKEQRKKNAKFPATDDLLTFPYGPSLQKDASGNKVPVCGELLWKFKRKSVIKRKDGSQERNTPPIIYDATGRVVNDTVKYIGWGSTGKAVFKPYPYLSGKNAGVAFQLLGFQIASLEAPQDDAPELTPIAGGFVADDDSRPPIAPVAQADDELEDF